MKKYLMTGIAALAMCAAFTSCSKDTEFEPLTQEQLDQQKAEQITLAYNQAFVKTFGQPASNQTWGFGTNITRVANTNGNQWHDPAYYNLKYDAKVTIDEMNKVFNYVNNPDNVETVNQIPYTDYWVTQIWEGDVNKNANNVMAPASHSYPNQNGAITDIIGGAQMDKLMIKESANGDWIHCNNFNNATNGNYKEGGEGGRTLMLNSGTYSFGYTNSQASYFSEKYIIVPGEKIHSSLAGFYYVCFDFERGYTDAEWAQEKTMGSYEAWNGNNYQGGWNFSLEGNLNEDQVKAAIGQVNGRDIQNIQIKGYLNGDKHCDGDDNYTDWIVRISPAEVVSNYDGRIMAEDLCAQEGSDFDFNDVVFDWKVIENGAKAKIHLLAAGGTMSLRIGGTKENENSGVEVHAKFGVNPDIMVNTATDGAPKVVVKPYQDFEILASEANLNAFNADGSDIPIYVKKDGVWVELTAYTGAPAAKINCPVGTAWVDEYAKITWAYPNFAQYVNQPSIKWWESVNPTWVNLLLSDNTTPPTE